MQPSSGDASHARNACNACHVCHVCSVCSVCSGDLTFPLVGSAALSAKATTADDASKAFVAAPPAASAVEVIDAAPLTVESDTYSLTFDATSGLLSKIVNKKSGAATDLSISWGW